MKEKITEASIRLFEQKGFSETSIQDIADELGVTKGTFYYYFPTKEQLLMEIHLQYIDDLLARQEIIGQTDESVEEKLKATVGLLITDIETHGPSGRVFMREVRHLAEENADEVKRKRERFRLNIEKLVEEGMETGEFRGDLRADMIAFAVLGVTNWSYQWFSPHGEVTAEELARIYSGMILHGIGAGMQKQVPEGGAKWNTVH